MLRFAGKAGLAARLGAWLFVAMACFSVSVMARGEEPAPWRIAVAGPMSGGSAHLGRAMVDAAQIRVDEINAAGGINGRQVELVEYDDKNDPKIAVEVAKRIVKDGNALLVIGHRSSGTSIAAGAIYKQHEVPAISGTATADELTVGNPWFFRVVYNNELQADFIANYINSVLKFKNATLVATDSVYGKSLSAAFKNAVEEIPLKIAHNFELSADSPDIDLDMSEIISELSLSPDSGIVFLAMNAKNAATFVREMRNSGFNYPIFGADSINQRFPSYFEPDPVMKTSPGDFTDQIYATTSMVWDVAKENAIRFRNAFRSKLGRLPDSAMALYYDAASIALSGIEQAKLDGTNLADDRSKLRDYLVSLDSVKRSFDGITGRIYFNSLGDAVKTVPVGIFQLDQFISAPVQLEPVANPIMVPNFSDKLSSGAIIPFGDGYVFATQIAYIGIDLNEVSNLNTATGNYVMDFYLWLRFRGDLNLRNIEFSNAVDDIKLINPIWSRERNGMNVVTYKIRGTFHGEFQFKHYPFDRQEVVLEIRHRDRTNESLNFVADRLGMQLIGEDATLLKRIRDEDVFRTTSGWQVTGAEIFQDLIKTASTLGETIFFKGEASLNFSRMKLVVQISRHLSSYSTTILLPMTILFVIGFLLFVVPIDELPPRLSGGILVLITVSLLRARLSNDLPNIGYLVSMDYIFFALQIAMWFGIAITVAVFWLYRHEKVAIARRVNLIGGLVYLMPIIAAVIYIWMTSV